MIRKGFAVFSILLLLSGCSPDRARDSCSPPETRPCDCGQGPSSGIEQCDPDGRWGPCTCTSDGGVDSGPGSDGQATDDGGGPDGTNPNFCQSLSDGQWCDTDDLVTCASGSEAGRSTCPHGCDSSPQGGSHICSDPNPTFCVGKLNGRWCDGNDLVYCQDDDVLWRILCQNGCESMPVGTPDRCYPITFCTTVPNPVSPTAPTDSCNFMDWNMSPDGFYLVSRFGTDADSTTWGHTTTCGWLQGHYDGHNCRYDVHSSSCLDNNYSIPWVQGHVDYIFDDVIAEVNAHMNGDVPNPLIFYVACAQRFNCGALLRVSHPENGRCVVVYTEDGGPGATYEGPSYGARRILDASPAVSHYLLVDNWGWANSDMLYVEWGLAGDVPGQACTPCQSTPAQAGTESSRTPWDPNHMQSGVDCR